MRWESPLAHAPGPWTGIIVVPTEKLQSSWDGALQLFGLKGSPNVWNGVEIPGTPSLLAHPSLWHKPFLRGPPQTPALSACI